MSFLFDRKLKKIAKKENIKAPDKCVENINNILYNIKVDINEKECNKHFNIKKICINVALASFIFTFVILPNFNLNVSYAMQNIPVLGKIVKIITVREYFQKDGKSEIDLKIPNVTDKENVNNESEANSEVNKETERLTRKIIDEYNKNKDPNQFYSVELNSEVIENSEEWFTLKLIISEVSASSDTKYVYYNIDKSKDKIMKLDDLFINDKYKNIIKNEIKRQMKIRMKEDKNKVFWIESEKEEWDFVDINENTNYYINDLGNIVIVFDKYEVGPGSIGTPEFEINKSLYKKLLK